MRTYNIPCLDSHKSFYGKAKAIETETHIFCQSYGTIVGYINRQTNRFVRTWGGYSATTMRHVNSFLAHNGMTLGGKNWWDSLGVESVPSVRF
jgi:hypothetical protein